MEGASGSGRQSSAARFRYSDLKEAAPAADASVRVGGWLWPAEAMGFQSGLRGRLGSGMAEERWGGAFRSCHWSRCGRVWVD
jgi:hypothetical protein